MNFHSAVGKMINGAKMRRPNWEKDNYIYIKEGIITFKDTEKAYISSASVFGNDWEEYKEDKSFCNNCGHITAVLHTITNLNKRVCRSCFSKYPEEDNDL